MNELDNTSSAKHRLSVGLVLLLGLALRLYAAYAGEGFHYFSINDEVSAYQFALAFLAGEPFAQYLAQPLFAGAQVPGPLWTLYWSGLYLLGGESAANAILYSAALNSLVVYLVYRLARNFMSGSYALMTTLLFAVLPWPIYHAAGLWNPTVLPMLGSLLFLAMWRACSVEGSRAVFFAALLLAAIPQFHMIGIFYIPVAALLLLLLSPGINWRWLLFGVVAGFSLYLPYLVGELTYGWVNTQKLFSSDTGFSWGWLKILSSPPSLISSVPGSVTPDDTKAFKEMGDHYFGTYLLPLTLSLLTLLAGFAVYFTYLKRFVMVASRVIKQRREAVAANRETLFIGGFILLPIIFFAISGHSYASRYALLIMPLLFLLPAILVQDSSSRRLQQRFALFVLLVSIYSGYLEVATYHYKAGLLSDSSQLMPSFRRLERISARLNGDAGAKARASLELSPFIQQQTGPYHKVYGVYPLYVELDQRYKYAKDEALAPRRYTLHIAAEPLAPRARVVYRDSSVVITAGRKSAL